MRPDLNKLMCERGRVRSTDTHRHYRKRKKFAPDLDPVDGGGPHCESMTIRYSSLGKEFNENLSPLYHQVRKAVGKPFDKFYSELSKVFDKRSVINQHILQHLYQYLATDIFENEDGDLVVRLPGHEIYLNKARIEFYVDPRDGIIKRNRGFHSWKDRLNASRAAAQKELDATYKIISDTLHLAKMQNGNWFLFDIKPVPAAGVVTDEYTGEYLTNDEQPNRRRYRSPTPQTYRCNKRSASKKVLKEHAIRG